MLFLSALLAGSAWAGAGSEAAGTRLGAGVFLYAAPGLGDPNFAETVVLLVRHGSEGAMGLIINRPTEAMAKEALPEAALAGLRVYRGGPVERDGILALLRGSRPPPVAERVLDGVFLVRPADLASVAGRGSAVDRDRDRVRVYAGYAGWGAGQLEKEIRLGGWVVGPAHADALFTREPEALWRKVFQLLQRRQAACPGQTTLVRFAGPMSEFQTRPRPGSRGQAPLFTTR